MNRKLIVMLLAAVLVLSVIAPFMPTAEAAGKYTVSLADASGKNTITANPGDTVTLTLSVANNPGIIGLGVDISYPKALSVSAHELPAEAFTNMFTTGKFMPNITTTEKNPFVFYMNQATGTTEKKLVTYNGTLYQLTFKIADNAAVGDYKITMAARKGTNFTADVDGSGKIKDGSIKDAPEITFVGCTIKVESICSSKGHSYGPWKKIGDTQHSRTCTVQGCGHEEKQNHAWDGGTVTKKPSCTQTGVTTYTCTAQGCGATKTESIAKDKHSYGEWKDTGNGNHTRTCTACKDPQTAEHTWNSGSVTKKASCKEEGIKTYACTVCNAKKTEAIKKLTTHTYANNCDADCNVCGATRSVTHKYKTTWSNSKTEHWHACSVCGDKKDVAAHVPGAEATETTAQKCTECGYVIKAALGHKCTFADVWTSDENGHWHACSGCETQDNYAKHGFENDCDPDCSICSYTRETTHKYAEEYSSDEINHWYACTACGDKQQLAAHEPGAEATATTAQTCTICGHEIKPALGGATEPTQAPTEETKVGTELPPEPLQIKIPLGIIFGVVGASTLILVVILLIKKKKNPKL